GHHQVMYGWDPEVNMFRDTRLWPGAGELIVSQSSTSSNKYVTQRGWGYRLDQSAGSGGAQVGYPFQRDAKGEPILANGQPVPDLSQCDSIDDIPSSGGIPSASVFCANTQTINHALFIRDSWSILPNLTVNFGLRWERQAISGQQDFENVVI